MDARRGERIGILAALTAATADPARLVGLLAGAEDDDRAVTLLREAFGLDEVQATAVLDGQFRMLVAVRRERLAQELDLLRAEWGPPVPATLAFAGRRSAVLTVDGQEHRVTGGGPQTVLSRATDLLTEEIAVPLRRPVDVAVSGLDGGPVRFTVDPGRTASYEYPDDVRG
ncbi:hypothetical protein ACI78T_00365 [Blastococcus sp. SYSU D00922]